MNEIKKIIDLSLNKSEIFINLGMKSPRGLLLYGSPGTGKTLLIRYICNELNYNIYTINGSEIISEYVGESENKLKTIFLEAEKNNPSIIFIDEIDSICNDRSNSESEIEKRIVSTLLTLMDGINSIGKVFIIGATNRVNTIDTALRRPGRFDREIEVPIPSKDNRMDILKKQLSNIPNNINESELYDINENINGFVGADVALLINESCLNCLKREYDIEDYENEEKRNKQFLLYIFIYIFFFSSFFYFFFFLLLLYIFLYHLHHLLLLLLLL